VHGAVIASEFETFGVAAHELALLGVPLVISSIPAFAEFFTPANAYVFQAENATDLAQAGLRLFEHLQVGRRSAVRLARPRYADPVEPYARVLALARSASGIPASRVDTRLVEAGIARLVALEQRLGGVGIVGSRRVQLELVSPDVALLKQQVRFLEGQLHALRKGYRAAKQEVDRLRRRQEALTSEMERADGSDAITMTTPVLTGSEATFKVADLRVGLRQELARTGSRMEELSKEYRRLHTAVERDAAELARTAEWLAVEGRQLAQLVAARRPLACAALNVHNARAHDALGLAPGSVPQCVVACGSAVYVHGTLDGGVHNSFVGDVARAGRDGAPVGHT
jgi:outer membrane murein-binding lipoprotein Lpp